MFHVENICSLVDAILFIACYLFWSVPSILFAVLLSFGRVLRHYYAASGPDPNCEACGASEPTVDYSYRCSTCADAVARTSDATSTRNTNASV